MMKTFGAILREQRRVAGISQRQLAERISVDFSYISKLENDRLPPPAADTTARIADAVGCKPEMLLAAARKLPVGVESTITEQPAALQFLQQASDLRLTQNEWERMIGQLHNLRGED
jgi:transcriptional regulator with XRE-family HTH domain